MTNVEKRRDFDLPEEDLEYLESLGLNWETLCEGNMRWLLMPDHKVPDGYNVEKATVALFISPSYPADGLDMVYFHPSLMRKDGKPIGATGATATIKGMAFQRWSRHYTPNNPWRPGVDNVSTHMALVDEWLAREFRIR